MAIRRLEARGMESRTTFEEHGTYVRCRFEGPFEFRALLELTGEIRAYCVEHGQRRVLVDITPSQGELGALERYEHAVLIAHTGGLGIRAAVLARPDQVFPDRFWETVTRNRGLAVRVVTDAAAALEWLLGGAP
jgi:hypothetical protein